MAYEPMTIEPVELEGSFITLAPLRSGHHAALCEAGLDKELWEWTTSAVHTPERMKDYIEAALEGEAARSCLPFVIIDKASGAIAGSTRYGNIDRHNRRVEIGWTWVGKRWQRTPVNTEAKYLLLRHAFERLGCIRVEFKTDSLNERSRRALLRIGATEEGILRNHMICDSGRIRHSVYYSIVEWEWPLVKSRLAGMLARPY